MATIFDTVHNADGTAFDGKVTLRLSPSPRFRTQDIVAAGDVILEPNALGFVSTEIAGGTYLVYVGASRPFEITVPAGDDIYVIHELRTDRYTDGTFDPIKTDLDGQGFNYKFSDGILMLINITTGAWHVVSLSDTPEEDSFTIGVANTPGEDILHRIEQGSFQLQNTVDDKWHSITLNGVYPDCEIVVNAEGDYPDNYRYHGGKLQIVNDDTGEYHTLAVKSPTGTLGFAVYPGEV